MDLKSIQNTGTVKGKGYDTGKKSDIKLYIGVDILELSHVIMVTTSNVTDRNGEAEAIGYYCDVTNNLSFVNKVLVNGGYTEETLQIGKVP